MTGIKLQILPILMDSGGDVICGHMGLRAARQLKYEQGPVIVLRRLIEAQKGVALVSARDANVMRGERGDGRIVTGAEFGGSPVADPS